MTFTGSNGLPMSGVALHFKSDSVLVGVQDEKKPYVSLRTIKGKTISVPNNSVWQVPFTSITEVT